MSLYSGHRQATSKNFLNLQKLSVQHTLMRSSDSGPLDLDAAEVTTGCDWVELMSFLFPLHLRAYTLLHKGTGEIFLSVELQFVHYGSKYLSSYFNCGFQRICQIQWDYSSHQKEPQTLQYGGGTGSFCGLELHWDFYQTLSGRHLWSCFRMIHQLFRLSLESDPIYMEQTIIILCLACISIIRLLNQLEGTFNKCWCMSFFTMMRTPLLLLVLALLGERKKSIKV